jgi:hypothetical protein
MKRLMLLPLTAFLISAHLVTSTAQSTLSDQTEVAVTAYNNNIALVRDRRKLSLDTGIHELTFMDVAQHIRPETVSLRSLSEAGSLHVLEQNYEFDLISPSKLLEKYLGKKVKLHNFSEDINFKEVDAELISLNGGAIYKVGDQIHLNHPGSVILPEIPANLIAKPSLVWLLDNKLPQQDIAVTYITGGIRWNADYVITLDRSDTLLDIEGYVTLHNQSGTSYNNAQLKLIAGDVHRAPTGGGQEMHKFARAAMMSNADSMQQEAFGDFHLYKLPRRTTIKDNQSKQVYLLSAQGVQAHKEYEYRGQPLYYHHAPLKNQKVGVYLKFKNSETNHLGLPLPAGVIRVYQEDSEGALQFAGEDSIAHTPKDEEVTIQLGNAFDIVAERTQTDYQGFGNNGHKAGYEIKIRNHKDSAVTVNVIESFGNNWEILKSSHQYTKRDAFTAAFPIAVPANGETVLTYRVEVRP